MNKHILVLVPLKKKHLHIDVLLAAVLHMHFGDLQSISYEHSINQDKKN